MSGESDTLDARIAVLGATGTPLPGNREFTPAALRSATRAFLQMRGEYRLRVRLDGTNREAHLPGPLETFAPIQATRTPGSVP